MNQEEEQIWWRDSSLGTDTMKDHQTFSDKQWHQKEGARWRKRTTNLRAYLLNIKETPEILFRVLKRYCTHKKKRLL